MIKGEKLLLPVTGSGSKNVFLVKKSKNSLKIGVAVDDFFSNSMDPTWNVEINIFDGYSAQKKLI